MPPPSVPSGPAVFWPPDPSLAKADLRRLCRRRRREALPAAAAGIREVAHHGLPSLLAAGGRLGIYWPLAGEADLRSLAGQQGLRDRLALPAVEPCRRLVYRPWRSGMALLPDACGIPSPPGPEAGGGEALPAKALALLLVPALAVDATALRLGSGGGFYDRLRAAPAWRAVPALAVLPMACVVSALPRDPWDVPFDGWLDEAGLHRPEA